MAIFVFIGSFLTLLIQFSEQEIRTADELLMSFLQTHHATLSGGSNPVIPSRTQSTASNQRISTYSSPAIIISTPPIATNKGKEGGGGGEESNNNTTNNNNDNSMPITPAAAIPHNVSQIMVSDPPGTINQDKEKDTVELAHASPGFVIH